jgi:taurine dioxygenase
MSVYMYYKADKPYVSNLEAASSFKAITVTPASPNIGAEISGIDATKPLSEAQVDELRDAFTRYQVLFFRNQAISNEDQIRLAGYFGSLGQHVAKFSNSIQTENPLIRRFHYDEKSEMISGEAFHSDLSSSQYPPLASMLYLHTIPPNGGGDTMFSSMYAAYNTLSEGMKRYLEPLTATHDGTRIFGPGTPVSVHPVIVTHPVSGKKAIYINGAYVTRINDIPHLESERIIQFLVDHCNDDRWICRFRWTPNSIAFWDNRSVQHKALWDYWPSVRSGYRVQLEGTPEASIPGWPA